MKGKRYIAGRVLGLLVLSIFSFLFSARAWARDTVYVSGGIEHEGLFPTRDAATLRSKPRPQWAKIDHLSNSYLDLSLHYVNDSNKAHFRELRVSTRAELTEWPLPGFEYDFGGHGISHLSAEASFDWGSVAIGDVYDQFGSGLILNLYEDRLLGVDNPLRGAKIDLTPIEGLHMVAIGGKQRRNWECYDDGAWGWNYRQDAAVGGDVEIDVGAWSKRMKDLEMHLLFGGSYVSRYEAPDTILTIVNNELYQYRLPRWVGAGDIRAEWQMKGWHVLAEYARKANDPTFENGFSYRDGDAWLLSAGYSRKGLAVLAQVKRSENMSFRSQRERTGIAGRLNYMPPFAQQHTYSLATQYAYATQYTLGEWAFQGQVYYTWARKTRMGGKYGTTLKLNGAHIRGVHKEGEYYTDVNLELNKRISKRWWLNAMLMYQRFNQAVVEGKGGMIRSGIAVVDARVQATKELSVRGELQYLYTPDDKGQWCFALCEISLFKRLMISGQWMYNIGGTANADHEHYYSASVTYSHNAHRIMAGYTKTIDGFNCSGGVCRYVPKQEGVHITYNFTW